MPLSKKFTIRGSVPGLPTEKGVSSLEIAKRTQAIAAAIVPVIASIRPKCEAITRIDEDLVESVSAVDFRGVSEIEEIELTFVVDGEERKRRFTVEEFNQL